ncbi:MAG TPA: hypothetical protein GX714_17075 [Chloroflexi bacterium]|jgi:uncharacterized protein YaaQ|nr:hypothetical protein [Chloroflexota bacterium]
MKLILAIVRDDCAADITGALNEGGYRVTRISSTGGFWRRGNVTLLVGVEEYELEPVLSIIDQHSGPCVDVGAGPSDAQHPPHRATVFVLPVHRFAHY